MKKVIALLIAILLIVCFSIPAFAANDSNPGGPDGPPVAPPTGAIVVAALAAVAVGAGAVYAFTNKKSK